MAETFTIRQATLADLPALLALNQTEVPHVGDIDSTRMDHLFAVAFAVCVCEISGALAGFVICMDQDADYDSMNYLWFKERYARFAYVDRIVVSEKFRRRGIAGKLYEACLAARALRGLPLLALEYNIEPPNPVSAAFHAAQGFHEVGRRRNAESDTSGVHKEVSMQVIEIDAALEPQP